MAALAGLVIAVAFAAGALLYARRNVAATQSAAAAERLRESDAQRAAEQESKAILLAAKEDAARRRDEVESEVRERRSEVARQEQRISQREESLERRLRDLESNEQRLGRRETELEALRQAIEEERAAIELELSRVAGLSEQEARDELLRSVEGELTPEIAERIRAAEAAVREEAAERTREVLITAMQRMASEQTGEAAVTVVQLPSDELKGRIIGREGRNIRALEAATGVDVIVDDTPETIVLSAFDPVRREVARAALERLFADGRIHPARIEETVGKARNELAQRIKQDGEQACQELGIANVHPELQRLLGTLRYRTTFGQNVLSHSKDTAGIAGLIAAEIGFDEQVAKEAALFHDIGKAVEHDVEGPHALVGGEILARLGRKPAVVHAVRSHHYDEEPRSIAAMILLTADAISAGRVGARREGLAGSVKRLERIEAIANDFEGVEHSFAVQAGKELRVLVRPDEVSDDEAQVMARQIAKRLHAEGSYSGRIKVAVLRETRSVEYAK
ncbi:MAG: ribonuclease Y [Candidatus Dormibacteraeota bacterium]|nr:ribonuclease Y [Candidatus Dormibacteraeota bacterium]